MPQFDVQVFVSQLFWMAVFLGIIYAVLSRRAVPRMETVLEERADKIEGQLAETERIKAQTQKIQEDVDFLLQRARREANDLVTMALHEANLLTVQRRNEFNDTAKKRISASEKSMERKKEKATQEIYSMVEETTEALLEKLVALHLPRSLMESSLRSLSPQKDSADSQKEGGTYVS